MKKFILILIFLFSFQAHSVTLDFIGACSHEPLLSIETTAKFETIGDLTLHFLNKYRVPYQGNERGMNSIFNTPLGLETLEVLSDTQMRSYGWCFRVNGVVPYIYADEIYLNEGDHIEWFYAYAWYDKGWGEMCNPSYEVKSPWVCK